MFNPQIVLIALLAMLSSLGFGFYNGYEWHKTKAEAQRARDQDAYQTQLNKQMKVANDLADRLAKAEGRITTKTIEVIKYVTNTTTGTTRCLGPDTISVLQPGSNTGLRPPASVDAPEDAGSFAASDRDVAYFIAEANQQYDTCAVRLNTLVDFELATNPEPK